MKTLPAGSTTVYVSAGPTGNRFAGLADKVHALEVELEKRPAAFYQWADARLLAFDLAVEAGKIDAATEEGTRGDVARAEI